MKRFLCIGLSLVMLCVFTSCEKKPLSRTVTALDTVCTVSLYDVKDQNTLDAACAVITEYEQYWSRTIDGSDIAVLNASGGTATAVNADTYALLQTAQAYAVVTGGAFDITTATMTDLWKAAQTRGSVPTEAELTAARFLTGSHRITFGDGTVTLEADTAIDLGAIAKGAIADKVAQTLKAQGCQSALIDLGGNIVAVGTKPDGQPFEIGIADPFAPERLIGTIEVSDRAAVTSGSYQRGFQIGDTWYSHIVNPKTGMPVDNDLASVTILAPLAVDADALATACFVMGFEKANAFLASYPDVDAVFVKTNGSVIATDGVKRVE